MTVIKEMFIKIVVRKWGKTDLLDIVSAVVFNHLYVNWNKKHEKPRIV